MNQITETYAGALIELGTPSQDVEAAADCFNQCPLLRDALSSPIIADEEKDRVIHRVFPPSLHGFFQLLYRNGRMDEVTEIFRDYRSQKRRNIHRIKATVEYVTPLTPHQQDGIVDFVKKKTGYSDVELDLVQRPELLGGFILRAGDFRYDRSTVYIMSKLGKKLKRENRTEIAAGSSDYRAQSNVDIHKMKATVEYVTPLTETQQKEMIQLVKEKTRYEDVELNLVYRPELLGGFVLRAGSFRYDCSKLRSIRDMRKKLKRGE